jgi:four helix bundle protein
MDQIVSFRDLDAWQASMVLVVSTYRLAATLPHTEEFGLRSQMRRAAVSIPSNIAEGNAGSGRRRYLHHVRLALGSLAELETQIEIARRLGFLKAASPEDITQEMARTGRLLHGLVRSLRMATKTVGP